MLDLQGNEITNDAVKDAIIFKNVPERIQNLILNKIKIANDVWLNQFLLVITGSDSISIDTKIEIGVSFNANNEFEIHTCFNSLDIPFNSAELMTDSEFLINFDVILQNHESYNIV